MSYLKQEFIAYMHNERGNINPGAYCNGLDNIEKLLKVDIDEEYLKDKGEGLYKHLQALRETPELIGKNEHTVRQYAAQFNRYIDFRNWKNDKNIKEQNQKGKNTPNIAEGLYYTLDKYITYYKNNFNNIWKEEKFKWEAIKHFQENWNWDADNFSEMLKLSFSKCKNLLNSSNNYPAGMIEYFAEKDPVNVKAMFEGLFDEKVDLFVRIREFKLLSDKLFEKYGNPTDQNHYQNENSITTYLWLYYPDKYYIYKYSEVRAVAEKLGVGKIIKKGSYENNIKNFINLYDNICLYLSKDEELKYMLKEKIDDKCYSDEMLKTLTVDVGFYISRYDEWHPKDYSPKLTVEDWEKLLNDKSVFDVTSLEIMKRMKDIGGQATCKQLSLKYGKEINFYNKGSSALAKRVADATSRLVYENKEGDRSYWAILYLGKDTENKEEGTFIWKLRDELSKALDLIDLSDIELYVKESDGEVNYWWLVANPNTWSFDNIAINEEIEYSFFNDKGNKRKIFPNFLSAKENDKVVCYESNPRKQAVALGVVSKVNEGHSIYVKKIENINPAIDYNIFKESSELSNMQFFQNQMGTLFKLTKEEYEYIVGMITDDDADIEPPKPVRENERYSKEQFLSGVYMKESDYDELKALLLNKKNVILQGAPGVGKTFAANRLAYSIMGEVDDNRIKFVQFHQNYSYEDFVIGYKPEGNSFVIKEGVFYKFCEEARKNREEDYFFIIDEINRGNMSKIFGELLMLIESDYRERKIVLSCGDKEFYVPDNLYIIGMMNTADRSLAMIDYALRRRFSFFDMEPGFESAGFRAYQAELDNENFDKLIEEIKKLNEYIGSSDSGLGKGYCIGHSYFCGRDNTNDKKLCDDNWIKSVIKYDILPMLKEYWFDDESNYKKWKDNLEEVL